MLISPPLFVPAFKAGNPERQLILPTVTNMKHVTLSVSTVTFPIHRPCMTLLRLNIIVESPANRLLCWNVVSIAQGDGEIQLVFRP